MYSKNDYVERPTFTKEEEKNELWFSFAKKNSLIKKPDDFAALNVSFQSSSLCIIWLKYSPPTIVIGPKKCMHLEIIDL